jgi:hypothetical protein
MKIKRKSRFWTGIFSLIPGCVEMYWGFMKMGISLLTLFAVVFFLAVTFEFGPLVLFMLVIWAYGFFHARNIVHMDDEELVNLKDEYLFEKDMFENWHMLRNRGLHKILAITLIVLGVYLIVQEGFQMAYRFLPVAVVDAVIRVFVYIPRMGFGILIIVIGTKLIRGKKQEVLEEKDEED